MQGLEQAKHKIQGARDIAVACHINPDGDAIGSLLSLGQGLQKLGKCVYMISPDGVPKKYRVLPGASAVVNKIDKRVELAIAVDCNAEDMLGESLIVFKQAKDILEIDHHQFRRPFGDIAFVDPKAAAVGELIYVLLEGLGVIVNKDIAQNILTSIIVETDSFRLPHTRALTFRICAQLLASGLDFHKLTELIYWSRNKEAAVLSGICLARCKFVKNDRIAWSIIKRRDFKMIKGVAEDVDAVADEIRAIKGVQIAVLFREKNKDFLRVSIRSKGKLNVALLAASFGGGGHFDSAGCSIPNKAGSVKELLSRAQGLLKKRK